MLIRTALLASTLSFSAFAAEAPKPEHFQRAGMWETRTVLERDGKKGSPIVKHRCIPATDVEAEENRLFQPFEKGCAGQRHVTGKTWSWTFSCVGPLPMKGSGTLTYKKDQYSGTSETFADLNGEKLRMTRTGVEFSARRIGECAAGVTEMPSKPGKAFKKKKLSASPDVAAASGSTATR